MPQPGSVHYGSCSTWYSLLNILFDMILDSYICDLFQCTLDELYSKTRLRQVVMARQLCMTVLKEFSGMSLSQIGSRYGDKDHSTVIHSIRTVKNLYATDKAYRAKVDEVYDAIHSGLVMNGSDYMDEEMLIYAELI
jgi:hypothetical protein